MLGIGRVTALLFPVSRIKKNVESSTHRYEGTVIDKDAVNGRCIAEIEIIKWSVSVMSKYTPWKSNCFAQALAAHKMLVRLGIPSTLYFGLAKEEGDMAAHAWLMYKDIVVTGENEKDRFKIVMQIGYFKE